MPTDEAKPTAGDRCPFFRGVCDVGGCPHRPGCQQAAADLDELAGLTIEQIWAGALPTDVDAA